MRLSKEERAGAAALAAVVICVLLVPLLTRTCSRHDNKPMPVVTVIQTPPSAQNDTLPAGKTSKQRSSSTARVPSDSLHSRVPARKRAKNRNTNPETSSKPLPLDISIETKTR